MDDLAQELGEIDPRAVDTFKPDNLSEVMDDFLSGRRRNPDNAVYSILDGIDFEARHKQYEALLAEVTDHPDIPRKHHHTYEQYIQRSKDVLELMRQASLFRIAEVEEDRRLARDKFQEFNTALYGKPEKDIAQAMARELLDDSDNLTDPIVRKIRNEFLELLPSELSELGSLARPKPNPSQEARDTIGRVVELIYSPLLAHTDRLLDNLAEEGAVSKDELKVSPQGIAVIFQEIINHEFPDSGWSTVLDEANAIHVDVSSKKIKIPQNRVPASIEKVRGLVVHELGVHMLRSIIGERSNLIPLRFGLSGGNEAEEGIAKVMESALTDDAERTGYHHYLTAYLLGQGMDFRDAHEIMWRYRVVDVHLNKPDEIVDDKFIERSKEEAFKFMFRSIRGTNELPWHLTLGYFRGTARMWNFVEKHKDDPDFIAIMFMGKIDPTNQDHLHSAFNAMSRV